MFMAMVIAGHMSLGLHGSASSVRGVVSNLCTVDLRKLVADQLVVDIDKFSSVEQ
jgi:hypothetical protein